MACCQLWQPVTLLLIAAFAVPVTTSDDHPNLFVRRETFLGLVVPECPEWQCEGRCESISTLTSNTRYWCQCDDKCLLYGDCCYDFFFNCRGLPNDEIQDIIHKNRKGAYESIKLGRLPTQQGIHDVAEYQRCVPGITDPKSMQPTSVYLISVCAETWSNNKTRELCERSSGNILNTIPVTNRDSNQHTYRNLHCALCHGLSVDSVEFWKTDLNCEKEFDVSDLLNLDLIYELITSGSCILKISPPITGISIGELRACNPISNTTSIGCIQHPNAVSQNNPEHWYIMMVTNPNETLFLNPHQAESCLGRSDPLRCETLKRDPVGDIPVSTALKAELVIHERKNVLQPMIKTAEGIHLMKHSKCREEKVYDHFKGRCVLIDCPSGWYGHNGDCLPYEVSQYPTNYITHTSDISVGVVHLTFNSTIDQTECDSVWTQETVIRVMNLLTDGPGLLIKKGCSKSSQRNKTDRKVFLHALRTRSNETSTDPKTSKSNEKKKAKNLKRQIINKAMADSKPIVSSKEMTSDNKDAIAAEATTGISISKDLKDKLINMVGIQSPEPQYIHLELEITNFDLMQLSNLMFLLGVETKEAQRGLDQDHLHLLSVEFFNFNSTPICEHSLEIKHNLKMYQREDVLHGIDLDEKKQLPLDNVPFSTSLGLNEKEKLTTSTSVFLCRIPTTKPPLLECPSTLQYYDEHDFSLTNNSLFVYSNKKMFEKGTFQIRGTFAYVCTVANVTNVTSSATVHRGFFTMPYTQYIVVMVCCCLSLACLLATFVTYTCFAQLRDISGIILMCLTVSLFVAQLLFTGGVDQVEIKPVCVTIAISLHFLWLSVFSWMNVLTYDIAHKLRLSSDETADKDAKAFKEYCIFAWGVPFLLVGICAALDFAKGSGFEMQYAEDSCWMGSVLASLFGFALPVVLLLLANLTLFSCTIYALHAVARVAQLSEKQKTSRKLLVIYSALTLIMGLTWGSAYTAALLDLQEMWHVFGALNALQGIFIVCCFVLKTRVVQLYKTRFSNERKVEYPPEEFL